MKGGFLIKGGKALRGEVRIGGYKNSAGAILCATLLSEEDCVIDNIPLVSDIFGLIKILKEMGVEIEWLDEKKIKVNAKNIDPQKLDFEEIEKSRVSVLLLAPLFVRFKNFKFPHPGGDKIGLRPITTHLEGFKSLGAEIFQEGSFYYFKREKELVGRKIVLKEFSVTATENLMMAGVLARGETEIKLAAAEPQVQDLGELLRKMGAKIEGLGSHHLKIKGVKRLKGVYHKIISDPLEVGTFVIASLITQGEIKINHVNFNHLEIFLERLKEMGARLKIESKDSLKIFPSLKLKPIKIQALPYPGFPTDLIPPLIPLLTQIRGKSLIHDPLYENRFNFIQELRKMGADIEIVDPHRAFIFGKTELIGNKIESWDIRAGASLILAGLCARGETLIRNISQIDRGYEKIDEKLKNLGAEIKRI